MWKICSPKSLCSPLRLRLELRGARCRGSLWVQSPAPGADRVLPGKGGDLGGRPSLAAPQPAAGAAREGDSSRAADAASFPSRATQRRGQRRTKFKHIFMCFPKLPESPNVLFTVCFGCLCQKVSGPLLSNTGPRLSCTTCRRSCLDRVCLQDDTRIQSIKGY